MTSHDIQKAVSKFCFSFFDLERYPFYEHQDLNALFVPLLLSYRQLVNMLKVADKEQKVLILSHLDMDPEKYITEETYPLLTILANMEGTLFPFTHGDYELLLMGLTNGTHLISTDNLYYNNIPNAFYQVAFVELLYYLPAQKPITARLDRIRKIEIEEKINNRNVDNTFKIVVPPRKKKQDD